VNHTMVRLYPTSIVLRTFLTCSRTLNHFLNPHSSISSSTFQLPTFHRPHFAVLISSPSFRRSHFIALISSPSFHCSHFILISSSSFHHFIFIILILFSSSTFHLVLISFRSHVISFGSHFISFSCNFISFSCNFISFSFHLVLISFSPHYLHLLNLKRSQYLYYIDFIQKKLVGSQALMASDGVNNGVFAFTLIKGMKQRKEGSGKGRGKREGKNVHTQED
jgi:hypothetical protein